MIDTLTLLVPVICLLFAFIYDYGIFVIRGRNHTISTLSRNLSEKYPITAVVVGIIIGLILGHIYG